MRTLLLASASALWLCASSVARAECPSLLNHQYKTLQGGEVNLCDYADRPILVVNTASKCGFTPQFEKLEGLYRRYKDNGLMVWASPPTTSGQELVTNKEIGEFCLQTYRVQFPMIEKSSVTGASADPLYRQLLEATGQPPKWNFHKYLIAPGGKQVLSFATQVEPDSPEMMNKLKPLLR